MNSGGRIIRILWGCLAAVLVVGIVMRREEAQQGIILFTVLWVVSRALSEAILSADP